MQIIDYVMARFHHGEEGQTMAEYAVVLAVITVVIIAALTALSGGIKGAFDKVTAVLQ
ncbi:MAG: Flp/Fap pilin component [Thermoleophilia bacterium]|nr:Flp/Fap pilin component [Thermoleophilia bacterium]